MGLSYWLRGNVGAMVVSWFLFAISGSLTQPYMSMYLHMLGASDIEIGLVRSLGSLAVLLTILPGGVLTDVVGRKRSIVVGTWGIAAVQFLYAVVQDWRQFAVVYVVDWALHFYQPALTAILLDSLPPHRRGGGMMLTAVLPQVPWLFLPPVGGYLLDHMGLLGMRLSFVLSGLVSVTVAVLRMRALEETIEVRPLDGRRLLREVVRSYAIWRGVRLMSPFMAYVAFLGFVTSFAGTALQTFGVLYAVNVVGIDNTSWGVTQSAATAVGILFGLVLMSVIDKAPRVTALFSGLLLMSVGYLMLGLWKNIVSLVTAAIIVGVGGEVAMSIRRALVGDLITPENRGRVMGSTLALEYMGSIAGGVSIAHLYAASPHLAFLASGIALAAASLPLLRRLASP
ncbi:MFS transporter [Pyrobaculum neutrophilum]|uniref:Major facilitator superfamily MFS_1 n=1 Tax=Pyrobaculum neutrophilum (strain DSM 2338 / JCM 9278 / NBRC 100436 / V24Sta) TaxID=444157 RepID=B1Y8S9_PYRNV|nr:MFS transporter [Pyrobaculum neutrophilum]ACB40158.1 major facilitator superfamily MFS_1 [Pyrobaculum neutrophilum V24Sta]